MTAKPPSSKGLSVAVEVDKAALARMKASHAEYVREVKAESLRTAERHARGLVGAIRAQAGAKGKQAKLAANSVRYAGSHPPTISAGGPGLLPTTRTTRRPSGGDVFFGSEFGGSPPQFPPHTKGGRWFFPTITAAKPKLRRAYEAALDRAATKWGSRG